MTDVRTWLLWAAAGTLVACSTRNPLYLTLLLLVALTVDRRTGPLRLRRLPFRPLPLTLIAVIAGMLFNALTAHVGETVLVALPDWFPVVGGPITLEALVFGATNGLALGAIYALFFVFNQVTSVHDLVGLAPAGFHEVRLVISIALTFVPETTRALARIREAQAVRGHHLRRLQDWLPIVVPLVVGSLERSHALAEAMVARGYGAVTPRDQPARLKAILALGLVMLAGGWLVALLGVGATAVGALGVLAGAILILLAVRQAGRSAPRSAYLPRHWSPRDSALSLVIGASLLLVLTGQINYSPYPLIAAAPFEPAVGLGLLLLLSPAATPLNR